MTNVIAGRIPPDISENMNSHAEGLSQARQAFAKLGTFKRLQLVREESMQGYTAIITRQFPKGLAAHRLRDRF